MKRVTEVTAGSPVTSVTSQQGYRGSQGLARPESSKTWYFRLSRYWFAYAYANAYAYAYADAYAYAYAHTYV